MAYITKANYRKILRKIELSHIGEITGTVYKKPIYFFSKNEEKYLLLMQMLVREPEKFAVEFYKPILNRDTFTYVYESEQPPAYHLSRNCDRLNSSFKNFIVPLEIKSRVRKRGGDQEAEKEEVNKFRSWFQQHLELFQRDTEAFLKRLDIDWNIQRKISEVEMLNSGVKSIDNYSLEQLENEIDNILREAARYFVNNPDKQAMIRRFQKLTILTTSNKEIYNNDTELSDEELKAFLRMYDDQYKKPTKRLLIEYYRVKYNPDLSFEGRLLEILNFRQCTVCKEPDIEPTFLHDCLGTNHIKQHNVNHKKEIINKIIASATCNNHFLLRLISCHYPFTEEQLLKHKSIIKFGSGVLSCYEGEVIFQNASNAKYGLCFNHHILWSKRVLDICDFEANSYQWTGYDEKALPLSPEKEVKAKIDIALGWRDYSDTGKGDYSNLSEDDWEEIVDREYERFEETNKWIKKLNTILQEKFKFNHLHDLLSHI